MHLWPWLLCVCGLIGLATGAAAREPDYRASKPAVRKELIAVVEAQLAAFRAADFPQAYGFAATALQEQFPLQVFVQMVRRGYPAIADNEGAEFGLSMDNGRQAILPTAVKSAGREWAFNYLLVKEPSGWRINGVTAQERQRRPEA